MAVSPFSRKRHKPVPPPKPGVSLPVSRKKLVQLLAGTVIAGLTLFVYCPCFDHPFVNFDDEAYVTQNQHVTPGLTADGVRWAFTTFECGNWHPLTWLSLQLDCDLYGGLKAGGYHLTNVVLHTASAVLLFLVLSGMTGMVWRSAMVAALFALHPLNVEPVAWVAERKGVLSTLFWMLALASYLYYVRRPSILRYLLVVLALVLGLMAKPMLMMLPFVLVLLDYWPLQRWQSGAKLVPADGDQAAPGTPAVSWLFLLLEKLPLFVLVLAWTVIAFLAQLHIQALPSLEIYPLEVRLENALLSYVDYLGKMLWPVNLAVHYPHPGASVSLLWALGAAGILALITGLVFGPGRRRPYLAVGWLWYLGTLIPLIGLVQIGSHGQADRYTYIPLIGLFLLLTWGAADLMLSRRLPRFSQAAVAAVILSACAALTMVQVEYWKSSRDLWQHALAVTENNAMAHNGLGLYYYHQGSLEFAEQEFARAAAISPDHPQYHKNRSDALRELGRNEEAMAECHKVIELDPQESMNHFNLALLLHNLGRLEETKAEFQEAIHLAPNHPAPHHFLGDVLRELGRPQEAMAEYSRALELDPQYAFPHIGLGKILQAEGRLEEALNEYRKAVELGCKPALPRFQACQGLFLLRRRLPDLLAGKVQPADTRERLAFAELCGQPFEGRYALAVRLYTAAFAADARLVDDVWAGWRFNAAVAAARAGCGQGQDTKELDTQEKARFRQQARDWLQADLTAWTRQAQRNPLPNRAVVRQALGVWQREAGLKEVREAAALGQLPAAERAAWQTLWQDVEAVRAGASAPGG